MEISGEERIRASRVEVWSVLSAPSTFKECIPGCEALVPKSPTELEATIKVTFGPLKRSFRNVLVLSDINAPGTMTVSSAGGLGKGRIVLNLREEGEETLIGYTVTAKVGGAFALFGSKLIEASAANIVRRFFRRLKRVVDDNFQYMDLWDNDE